MLVQESLDTFAAFAAARGVELTGSAPINDVASAWLDFFRDERISDGSLQEGDMADALLFEWGTRKALPGYYESAFYINLTRQFIAAKGEDDDAMFQLTWQAEYEPTEELTKLGHYSEWCDTPSAYSYFKEQVLLSPSLLAVTANRPKGIQYFFSGV